MNIARKSELLCPACKTPLTKEEHPSRVVVSKPYILLFCDNPRCPSEVAQHDGGSADTEHRAWLALCHAVDNETEEQCDPVHIKERALDAKAEHQGDMERAGGA